MRHLHKLTTKKLNKIVFGKLTESCLISPLELKLKTQIELKKRAFVVKGHVTQLWNRLGSYFRVMRTTMMCKHQSHNMHTPDTCKKRRFSVFAIFSLKIRSYLRVPGVCLMCSHNCLINTSYKTRLELSNAVSQSKIRQKLAPVDPRKV